MNKNDCKIIKNENNNSQNQFGPSMNHFMPMYIPPSNQIGLHQNLRNNQVLNQNRQLLNNNNLQQPRQNQAQYINNNQIRESLVQPPSLARSLTFNPPPFIPPSPIFSNISNNNIAQIPNNAFQRPPIFGPNFRPPIHIPASHFDNNPHITKMLEEIELTEDMLDKNKEKECVICLEQFSPGDIISYLPCFHLYHFICIKNWIEKKNKCPLCNSEIKFE